MNERDVQTAISSSLELRLREWAREYRGGRYEHIGWPNKNILATLHEHHGFVPDSQIAKRIPVITTADEVENGVQALIRVDFKAAQALRVEYLCDHLPEAEKLSKLRRMGFSFSRAHYYDVLRIARAFVGGWLSNKAAA